MSISDVDPISTSELQIILADIVVALNSEDLERKLSGIRQVQELLESTHRPMTYLMLESGILTICTRFLIQSPIDTNLLLEVACVLLKLMTETSAQMRYLIKHNIVIPFKAMLKSESSYLAWKAVWVLGSVAQDGSIGRDHVIQHDIIDDIVRLVDRNVSIFFLRSVVKLMSNLCWNMHSQPPFEKLKPMLPVLSQLLVHEDTEVVSDACWSLSFLTQLVPDDCLVLYSLTDNDSSKLQAVVDTGAVPRLVDLLLREELEVVLPALRSVRNIVIGTNEQTDVVIAAGALPKFGALLKHSERDLVKEAAWAVKNIAAGTQAQIQALIDADIFHQITHLLENGDSSAVMLAVWAVNNTASNGGPEQIVSVIEKHMILKPYMDLLLSLDDGLISVVETGLADMLKATDKLGCTENLCLAIKELGGLEKLKALLKRENVDVHPQALAIIQKYFAPGEDQPE